MKARLMKLAAVGMAAAMLLTGCGGKGETGAPAETPVQEEGDADVDAPGAATADSGETWEVSLSTPLYEAGIWGQQLNWFSEQVKERTDGRVTVNVFFANALGEQKDMFTQLANGEIELICDGTLPIDYYAPEYGFIAAPFLLKGPDHLQAIIDSEYFDGFEAKLAENHILIGGIGLRNPRNTMTTAKFQWDGTNTSGLVIRTPDNALYVDAWSKLGANVQIMGGGEIYSSLQTGVLNACEGPYDQFLELKVEEFGEGYIYETEHVTEFFAIYLNDSWMNSLPEDIQKIINETAQEAMQKASDEVFANSETCKQTLIDAGYTFIDTIDKDALFETVAPIWEERFETDWNVADYDEIMSLAD